VALTPHPAGGVELDGAAATATGVRVLDLQDGGSDVRDQADVVADGGGLVARAT